jgi:hypothetical protein
MPRILFVVAALALVGCGSTSGKNDGGTGGGSGGGGGSNATCSPACTGTRVCDPATSTCVACLANTDCSGATPFCNTSTKTCAACVTNANCSGATPACNTTTGTCAGCVTSSDCPASAPACNAATGTCGSNDTCASPATITFVNGAAHLQGDTTSATNGNDAGDPAPCGSTAKASGNDLVYVYTLTDTSDVSVTVTPVGDGGMTYRPEAYIRAGACEDSSLTAEVACDYQVDSTPITISAQSLDAGTYYIWVDGTGSTAGPFTLDVIASPIPPKPANDDCAGVQALTVTNGMATATGSTRSATNSTATDGGSPSCSSIANSEGRDVVFSYDVTTVSDVTITVTPAPGSTLNPVVYVRGTGNCANEALSAELGCNAPFANSASTQKFRSQAAGTYFLWVDGSGSTSGAFTVTVTETTPVPPPANDECAGAIALTLDPTTGVGTASGDTTNAINSNTAAGVSPTCSALAKSAGQDVVYSYTLTAPKDVTIVATPGTTSTLDPVLYVRGTGNCANETQAAELGCNAPFTNSASTLKFRNQAAGTYYVWVDGSGSTSGTFDLAVTAITPVPAPANDDCGGAIALAIDPVTGIATASGDTTNATNSTYTDGGSPTCSISALTAGPDLVYSYTLAAPKDVTVTVVADGGLNPALYVRNVNACAIEKPASELVCVPDTAGVASADLANQQPGTYFVWVDSRLATVGTFALNLTATAPLPVPTNDTCATAKYWGLTTVGTSQMELVNLPAATSNIDTSTSMCGDPTGGPDVAYDIEVAGAGVGHTLVVTATPTATADPVLYARTGKCDADAGVEITCADIGFGGDPETMTIMNATGHYYVILKTWTSNPGRVTMKAELQP